LGFPDTNLGGDYTQNFLPDAATRRLNSAMHFLHSGGRLLRLYRNRTHAPHYLFHFGFVISETAHF